MWTLLLFAGYHAGCALSWNACHLANIVAAHFALENYKNVNCCATQRYGGRGSSHTIPNSIQKHFKYIT